MSEEEKKKLYVYTLIAALLGAGGSTGLQMSFPLRDDPFTGVEGRKLERRIDGVEARVLVLESQIQWRNRHIK